MDNDKVLEALEEFGRDPNSTDVPPVLGRYLERIATTGETFVSLSSVKPFFAHKLDEAMKKFHAEVPTDHLAPCPNVENISFDAMRRRLLNIVDSFTGTPFTIQRLCELITQPKKHYKCTDKFLRGIEKNMLVVSSVDPRGNKVVYESKPMVNGMSSNGLESVHGTPGKSFLTPPAPANSPVTIATGYNTNTETWAQGGGDAPITSEVMPPSPLTRQPIRSENSAVNTAPTLSPSVQGEGCTETTTITTTETQQTKSDSEQNQEAPDSEKKTTEEKLEIVQGKGNSESATAKETTTAADSTETGSEIDGRNDTKAEADNSGVSRTDQSQEQTQAVTGVEQDTEAQRSVSDSSEQSKNKSASTTVENTDSETDDALCRDSDDSGGFEASDSISDMEVPESSTGPAPVLNNQQQQAEAAKLQMPSSQPTSGGSSKRSQPADTGDSELPAQNPCKKLRLDNEHMTDSKEAECVEQTDTGKDRDEAGKEKQKCQKMQHGEEAMVADCSSSTVVVPTSAEKGKMQGSDGEKLTDANAPDSQTGSQTASETSSAMESDTPCTTNRSCTPSSSDPCTPSMCIDTLCTPSDSETGTASGATDDNNAVSSTQVVLPTERDNKDDINTSVQTTKDEPMNVDS